MWAEWMAHHMERLERKTRLLLRANTSRELREIRGTKMKTEMSAQPSAMYPPISSTSSVSNLAGT